MGEGSGPIKATYPGMFLCLGGSAKIRLDGGLYEFTRGAVGVYFPYSTLEVLERSEDLDGIIMTIDLEAIQPLLNRVADIDGLLVIRQHPVVLVSDETVKLTLEYIDLYLHHENLAQQYAANDQRHLWLLNSLQMERMRECLTLQIIVAFSGFLKSEKITIDRKDMIVRRFFVDLHMNYKTKHEVSFYSQQQFLSMRYFSFVVKEHTSQTPSYWIANALMNEAKRLLLETEKTVKEVSESLNFPNQSYFGKWFKARMGVSPLDFKLHTSPLS